MGAVGGAVAVGGTATVLGTQIANKCHNSSLLRRAEQAINEYSGYRNSVVEAWERMRNMCHAISIKVISFGVESIMQFAWQIFLNGDRVDIIGTAERVEAITRARHLVVGIPVCLGLGALIVGTGLCAYHLYELVISAKVIHKHAPHPAAVEIRNNVMANDVSI